MIFFNIVNITGPGTPNQAISSLSPPISVSDESAQSNRVKVHHISSDVYKPQYPNQTTYIICKNEEDLMQCFNRIVMKYRPQIITGFNSFGFDDNYMFTRIQMYGLENEYLQKHISRKLKPLIPPI